MSDLVSIIIPHYETRDLVTLCLRSLRQWTRHPIEVIVVDNDSRDDSLEYLRSVRWIRLIERGSAVSGNGTKAHREAMDVGMAAAKGNFLLSLHTDTIVKEPSWLEYLLSRIRTTEKTAAVGTWKLETISPWKRAGKALADPILDLGRRAFGTAAVRSPLYFRSHCALYRMDALSRHGLKFDAPSGAAGEAIYRGLVENGYNVVWLPEPELMKVMDHLSHATAYLTVPGMARTFQGRRHAARIARYFRRPHVRQILQDSFLDR